MLNWLYAKFGYWQIVFIHTESIGSVIWDTETVMTAKYLTKAIAVRDTNSLNYVSRRIPDRYYKIRFTPGTIRKRESNGSIYINS